MRHSGRKPRGRAAILAVLLCFAMLFSACGQSDSLEQEFLLSMAERTDSAGVADAAAFLDGNLSKVKKEAAEHMLVAYVDYLYRYIINDPNRLDLDQFAVFFNEETQQIDEEALARSELKDLYEQLEAGHLMLRKQGGSMVLKIDYESLLEAYGSRMKDGMKQLYALNAKTVEDPMTENASLRISWEELLSRAESAGVILRDFGEDQHIREDAAWLYRTYISTILMGATNTPIFSLADGSFNADARAAYEAYLDSEPDSFLSEVLREYFAYLERVDYTMHYNDVTESQQFFETCDYILLNAEQSLQK